MTSAQQAAPRTNDRRSKDRSRDRNQLQFLRQSARLEESGSPVLIRGMAWFLILFLGFFVWWMSVTPVEEMAQADGDIVPRGFIQLVQHFDGGIVQSIMVEDGTGVHEGDLLMTLNGAGVREDLRRAQIELEGLRKNLRIAQEALTIQQNLEAQGVSSRVRLLETQKNFTEVESAVNQQQEVVARLQDRTRRLEVRAPVSGVVKGLQVNTVGEVIKPGETLLEILPSDKDLVADIHIKPADAGHVAVGQPVRLKISSYDYSRYGTIDGTLDFISATTFNDDKNNKYYRGRVTLANTYVGTHKELAVVAGMTVQAGILTGRKSVLAYLLKPVQRAFSMALTEK